jgi:DNA mismatch endonuclease (patch repair protein)
VRTATPAKRPRSDVQPSRKAKPRAPATPKVRKTRRFLRNTRRRARRTKKKSGLESKVEAALTARGIEYRTQFPIGRCHADLYFPRSNTVVELHGCYWHAHSVCQKSLRHKRRRLRDARRYTFFRNKGYHLLIVWECEVNASLEAVIDRLAAVS